MDLREDLDLTYLFISHDLSVVEHISDRVMIMYLGRIVETATTDELFDAPNHPYTHALLNEVPRTRKPEHRLPSGFGRNPVTTGPPIRLSFSPPLSARPPGVAVRKFQFCGKSPAIVYRHAISMIPPNSSEFEPITLLPPRAAPVPVLFDSPLSGAGYVDVPAEAHQQSREFSSSHWVRWRVYLFHSSILSLT